MGDFNNMTVVAASEIIEGMCTHAAFTTLALQWNIDDRCGSGSVAARSNALAQIALRENPMVPTVKGRQPLEWAVVEHAITASQRVKDNKRTAWTKLTAGLRMDGFEVIEVEVNSGRENLWGEPVVEKQLEVRRMLPVDVPETDFHEAESELNLLLDGHGFVVSKGHLFQAISNFSSGNWAGANAQFRSFFESLVQEIAGRCGYQENGDHRARVRFLGELSPPFFLEYYNEWKSNDNAPQYLHGLMARLHPQGSHPGLSEEEDCTFRFQIVLITARLFLRRFDQGVL